MKEMDRERYGSSHALSKHVILPKYPHVHQQESSTNPVLLGFIGGFII